MVSIETALSKACELIQEFEGVEFEAYLDPTSVPTICSGITRYPNGMPVRMGDVCTSEVCKGYLQSYLEKEYLPSLELIPGWETLGADRKAVLLSFAWSVGAGFYDELGFERISKVLKDGAIDPNIYRNMRSALNSHVTVGGNKLLGLVRRRRKEADVWDMEHNDALEFVATQGTFLKKAAIDSRYLSNDGKQGMDQGDVISVGKLEELPCSSHAWVALSGTGERWAIYLPHWLPKSVNDSLEAPEATSAIDWNDFNSYVGMYISVGEVLQYDARRKPLRGSREESQLFKLCEEFDRLRIAWGDSIGVASGYRPEPINTQVGGVKGSLHTKGMALDIYPMNGEIHKFYEWLKPRWCGGLGDGRKRGFVHIDTRDNGHFTARPEVRPAAQWSY